MTRITNIACGALAAFTMTTSSAASKTDGFNYVADRFADIEVLRYKVPDFENLTLKQKQLIYHLTERSEERRVGKEC